jgi:mannan endo-1,4-beta-mannosidase
MRRSSRRCARHAKKRAAEHRTEAVVSFWDGTRWVPRVSPDEATERRRLRDWASTAVMVVVMAALVIPMLSSRAASPSLSLNPAKAVPGDRISLSATGVMPKARAVVLLDGTLTLTKVRTSPTGTASTTFVLPSADTGDHAVSLVVMTSSRRARNVSTTVLAEGTLTVQTTATTPPPATPEPTRSAAATAQPTPTSTPKPSPSDTPAPTVRSTASAPSATESNDATPDPSPSAQPTAVQSPPSTAVGWVTRSGTSLFENGQPFRFRGLNLYNINGDGDCGFAIPNLGDELDAVSASATVVRGWFFQYLATDHASGARDWSKFDSTLAKLRNHGMHVVVTLGDEWGACEGARSRGPLTIDWYRSGYRSTPYSANVRASYRDWVAEVVRRYRDDPTILAWQLMNEATAVSDSSLSCPDQDAAAAALQGWAQDVSAMIKQIDPNHLISVGTSGATQCGTTGQRYAALHRFPTVDLCESHDYSAPQVSFPQYVAFEISACHSLNKPIFAGEVGVRGSDVGCSLTARAGYLSDKIAAQMAAGMVGELAWAWRSELAGGSDPCSWDIGPGDPALGALGKP